MIISFSGLDGSGKTTHAKKTCGYLNNLEKKNVYVHIAGYSIFGRMSKLLQKRNIALYENIRDLEYSQVKGNKKRIVGLLKEITSILDLGVFYIKIYIEKVRKRIIVCDRYFYDILVQAQYFNFFGEHFSKLYLKLIPKPDIAFYLDLDPKISYNRSDKSKHQDLYFFKTKLDLYKNLTKYFKKISDTKINEKQDLINKQLMMISDNRI